MIDIKEKKQQRFLFLQKVYEKAEVYPNLSFSSYEIGEELGFDNKTADKIVTYLAAEKLVDCNGREQSISIKHKGVLEVEEALNHPNRPTEHFPPVINLIQITGSVHGSIQQGTIGSTQNSTINTQQVQDLKEIISFIKATQYQLNLDSEAQEELNSDIGTLEAQASSPKPKASILIETLKSVKSLLGKAATQLVVSSATETAKINVPGIIDMIDKWLSHNPV